MPNPSDFDNEDEWMSACVPEVKEEGSEHKAAIAECLSRWRRRDMESLFVLDNYVSVEDGEPFRLLPFGKLIKGGEEREVTPELATKFRLPHFKPPIKIGSHKDETPAGGHIKKLEVREDGLYAYPEFTESGKRTIDEGAFRYHSPEIAWDGGLEDPNTGELIEAPLIMGDALLHTPHLGEAAALYHVESLDKSYTKEKTMTDTVEVPMSVWDRFMTLFPSPDTEEQDPEPQEDAPEVDIDELEAIKSERDEYQSKVEKMEAKAEREQLESEIEGEFDTEEYGAAFQEMAEAEDTVDVLAGMEEEQREWVLTQFKAFSSQIDESNLTDEEGTIGEGIDADNAAEELDAIVSQRAKTDEITYGAALDLVKEEQPELVEEVYGG